MLSVIALYLARLSLQKHPKILIYVAAIMLQSPLEA